MNMRQLGLIIVLIVIVAGSVYVIGSRGLPAACSDGEIAVFETASNSWVCSPRGFVLLDSNGAEIGPVVSYNVLNAIVAVTLPDTNNTPRTVLLRSTGKRLSGFGFGTVYFTQPACTGDAFVQAMPDLPQLAPLYEIGHIDPVPPEKLYIVDQSTTTTPTLVSVRVAGVCAEQGPPDPTADFHPLDVLAADLQALYPAPHTLQAQ